MRSYALRTGARQFTARPAARAAAAPLPSGGLLSREQKARLCILAREAFARVHGRDPRDAAEIEEFRHAQVDAAVGKGGLTQCVQEDYKAVLARFLQLKGEDGHAFKAHVAHQSEPARLAMWKLKQSCAERGLPLSYPAAICRRQYRCELEQASAQQLWQLCYTVRSRRAAGGGKPRRRAAAASPKPARPAARQTDMPF
jgi:hypothetical protein